VCSSMFQGGQHQAGAAEFRRTFDHLRLPVLGCRKAGFRIEYAWYLSNPDDDAAAALSLWLLHLEFRNAWRRSSRCCRRSDAWD